MTDYIYLASDDWDVGGKKSEMLCTKCRIKFKKYGVDTPLDIDLDKQTPPDVRLIHFILISVMNIKCLITCLLIMFCLYNKNLSHVYILSNFYFFSLFQN